MLAALVGALLLANVVVPLARLLNTFGSEGVLRLPLSLLRSSPALSLPRSLNGRTNVLLLGLGWEPAEPLTDTMLLVSVDAANGRAALVSIPRDLAVAFPDGPRRINEAYRYGESQATGAGGEYTRTTAAALLGIEVQRFALIDIGGLRALVDDLHGVPVPVDRAFTDDFLGVSFDAGWQWLSGERALALARARHGDRGEGSDFSRIHRQQKVLLAVKDRLFSPSVLLDPLAVNRLVGDAIASVRTDLRSEEIVALARVASRMDSNAVERLSLADEGLVVEMRGSEGAYLLQPAGGDYSAIHRRMGLLLDGRAPGADEGRAGVIIPRRDWDPNPPRYDGPRQTVRRIVIHHDGVAYLPGTSGAEKVRHLLWSVRSGRGWPDLPYHYLVDVDGRVFEGRAESWSGETRSAYDPSDTLQIALLGNYGNQPPSPSQVKALVRLVESRAEAYALPAEAIRLHGDITPAECPGAAARGALAGRWSPAVTARPQSAPADEE